MPFKSKAQARYLYAKEPEVAKEFASKTESIKALPEHVKKVNRLVGRGNNKRVVKAGHK